MDVTNLTTAVLEKRLNKLRDQAVNCFPLLKGSVTIVGGKQQQPRFSWKTEKGKRRSLYLGVNKEPIAKKYHANYLRLSQIINEVSEINIELLRRLSVPRAKKSA